MQLQSYKSISSQQRGAGYTLIEILVVLAITGIIFSLGYAGFRAFSQRQAVNSSASGITADLKLASEQALSGKKPSDCTGSLNGYKFLINSGSSSYQVSASCTNNDSIVVKTVNLGPDVKISAPSVNPILFKPIGIGTNIPANTNVTIVVRHASLNYSVTITITSGGGVQ